MKVSDLVKFKDRSITSHPFGVALVVKIDQRPGVDMCTLIGPATKGKPRAFLTRHFEVISESR